jgi:hypothetical protein
LESVKEITYYRSHSTEAAWSRGRTLVLAGRSEVISRLFLDVGGFILPRCTAG